MNKITKWNKFHEIAFNAKAFIIYLGSFILLFKCTIWNSFESLYTYYVVKLCVHDSRRLSFLIWMASTYGIIRHVFQLNDTHLAFEYTTVHTCTVYGYYDNNRQQLLLHPWWFAIILLLVRIQGGHAFFCEKVEITLQKNYWKTIES